MENNYNYQQHNYNWENQYQENFYNSNNNTNYYNNINNQNPFSYQNKQNISIPYISYENAYNNNGYTQSNNSYTNYNNEFNTNFQYNESINQYNDNFSNNIENNFNFDNMNYDNADYNQFVDTNNIINEEIQFSNNNENFQYDINQLENNNNNFDFVASSNYNNNFGDNFEFKNIFNKNNVGENNNNANNQISSTNEFGDLKENDNNDNHQIFNINNFVEIKKNDNDDNNQILTSNYFLKSKKNFNNQNNNIFNKNNNFEESNINLNYNNKKIFNNKGVIKERNEFLKTGNTQIFNNNNIEGNIENINNYHDNIIAQNNEYFNNENKNINNENLDNNNKNTEYFNYDNKNIISQSKEYINNTNKIKSEQRKDYFNNIQKNNAEQNIENINNTNNNQIFNYKYDNLSKNIILQNNINNELVPQNTIVKTPTDNKQIIQLGFMTKARGLANVGATCYMNATLQCFYHVKKLSENLINDNEITSSMEITHCYKNLIEELTGCKHRKRYIINTNNYTYDEKLKDYFEPYEFKDLISRKNPLFKGIQANDSKDLIIFLLESMDTELTQRNNKNLPKEVFDGRNIEQTNEANFKKIHNSIFAEIFYGFQKSIMQCLNCNHIDETYNVFNFLIFPLEKVYNDLIKNKNNSNMNNNNMYNNMNSNMYNNMFNNMYNMFNMYNNMNNYNMNMYGNNMNMNIYNNNMSNMNMLSNMYMYNNMPNNMNMNYSNQYNEFKAKKDIKKLNFPTSITNSKLSLNNNNDNEIPKLTLYDCFKENECEEILSDSNQIFCNHCKRSSNAKTKNELYKIPNILILILNRGRGNSFKCDVDFPHQLDLSQFVNNPSSPNNYKLIGVISHLGESSMEGHFIAYCIHFDENWYLFNDGIVTQVAPNDIKKGTPYILFYQNINFN